MKAQVGWRVHKNVLKGFTEACEREDLRPSEAIEQFMHKTVKAGSVREALNRIEAVTPGAALARELKIKLLISEVQRGLKSQSFDYDWSDYLRPKYEQLLAALPTLADQELIQQIKGLADQINTALSTQK